MKKRFTIMIAAIIMLLTMLTLPGKVVGQTRGTEVTYDFSQISGFSDWGTGYSQHVVEYTEATVTFASANHQTGTITDIPVTKGQPVSLVLNNTDNYQITAATFVCSQWGTKAQTITLHYSTDGGSTYTSTGITSTNFTITSSSLAEGTNAVKITFSSTSNQVGIASCTFTFEETGGTPATPTTTTINVPNNFNNNMYNNNTTGGTLTASVTVTEGGAAVGGATVTWSSTNTSVATVADNGVVTLVGEGHTNITASFGGNATYSSSTSDPFALTVININPEGPGTIDNPYTVAQAREAINNGSGKIGAYSAGIIYQIDSYNSTYHSIQYWISDDGTNTNPLEVYGGLGLDDASNQFTSITGLAVGDKVMVYGDLKKFNSTYEYDKDNRLKVLIRATNANITYDATSGDITNIKVGGNISGGSFSVAVQSGNDWLNSPTLDLVNNKVTFTASANASASPRVGTIRITYTYNTDKTFYKDVTVTQGGAPQPLITAASPLAVPNYVQGTPEGSITAGSLSVTGSNLTQNITCTLDTDSKFVLYNGSSWTNETTINQNNGSASGSIQIRLKDGLSQNANAYTGSLTLSSGSATPVVVSLSGSVTYATLTYNGNGSDGGTVPAAVTNCTYNQSIEVAKPGTMSKTHYTFSVWNTKADGSGNNYDPAEEDTYTITADAILYAQWTINNHTITMPGTDTYGSYTSSPASTADYNAEVTLTFTPNTGYEMYEPTWSVNGDAIEGNKFNMPDEDVTVTVELTLNLNITYDFTITTPAEGDSYATHFYTDSELTTHPVAKSGDNTVNEGTLYYENGNSFTASGNKYCFHSGNYYMLGQTGALLNLPKFNNYKITKIIIHSSSGHSTAVQVSIVNGSNSVASYQTWSTTSTDYTYDIPVAYQTSDLSIKVENDKNTQFTSITLVRAAISSDPEISVSTEEIDNFSYNEGGGPSVKSFTVSGINLEDTPISVALETGTDFKLSLDDEAEEEDWTGSLNINPSDGTVAETTIYVRMNSGLSENTYTDNINVTWGESLSETVSLSGAVGPAPVTYSYVLATSIEPGKHYLITSGSSGSVIAMGYQDSNNRRGAPATVSNEDNKIHISNDVLNTQGNVFEFVISGDGTSPNYWTIVDEKHNNLYLNASSNGSNYLTTKALDDNGRWTISVTNAGVATITAQGSNSRKRMRYNPNNNNPLFACYATDSETGDLPYLFVRESEDRDIYSATNINNNMTLAGDVNIHAGVVTIKGEKKLTVNGTLTNSNVTNLIIEDGGQLVISNDVVATVKKDIAKYNNASDKDGWYTIASPAAEANVSLAQLGTYDLFAYDEEHHQWLNVKDQDNSITAFAQGQGFLYANSANQTLPFAGTMKASNATVTVQLSYESADGKLKGFNLVGNPFTCNVTSEMVTMNGEALTTYYVAEGGSNLVTRNLASTPIKPGRGFFVQAPATCNLVFNPGAKGEMDYKPTFISIEAGNSEFTDRAYVQLGYGNTLRKMSINDNTPMVYVMNNDADYASAKVDALKGTMPVCFRAKETGHYTISVATEGLDMSYLHLIDRLTGADIDLLIEPSYSFIATKDDNQSRFILSFTADCFNEDEDEIFAYQNGNEIFVNGEGELQVFDVMGRMVATQRINGVETVNIPTRGVYIMRLNEKTQKIVVR